MRRCKHSVKIPDDVEGEASPYCSGCVPAVSKRIEAIKYECEADERKPECPLCLSKDFSYHDETNYICPRCGYDNHFIL
jgi:hypothetical protein